MCLLLRVLWSDNLPGSLNVNILRPVENVKGARLTLNLANGLLSYAMEREPSLHKGFKTLHILKLCLSGGENLESIPVWLKEGKLAAGRFELLLDSAGKQMLKKVVAEQGASAALDKIQQSDIEVTAGLQQAVNVLKQAKLLDEIKADFTPAEDLSTTSHCMKLMLTASSLSIEDIRYFYPEVPERIRSFSTTVESHMDSVFGKIEAHLKFGTKFLSDYRHGTDTKTSS